MASSPPAAFPAGLPNPKKRPSLSGASGSQNTAKRPKLHPLRQTSFPAQDVSALYGSAATSARSETGSLANSLMSGVSGKAPTRGRGRPRKSTQLNDDDLRASQAQATETGSQADGSGRAGGRGGTKSVISARSGAGEADEDDEGDIDGLLENMDEHERQQAEEDESRQEQRRERLADTFDPDQYSRYNQWRALSLNNTTIKKLVNAIVSQSVTQAPLQAIRIYGKWFVGEIVERARDVQTEYAKAYDETREAERQARRRELQALEEKQKGGRLSDLESRILVKDIARLRKEVSEYIPNPHRGGLLPDHLREAVRRYKADGEGGGVGFQGMSHALLGVQGSGAWRVGDGASGKHLFK